MQIPFDEAGRLPEPGDNAAIASRRLEAGTEINFNGSAFVLPHTILEGHRFAVAEIPAGERLLSWGLPFGLALRPIRRGDYVCNAKILKALNERHVPFPLPGSPNFEDYAAPYQLDEAGFRPAEQIPLASNPRTFMGFDRGPRRGAGTRNFIVVFGLSSLAGSFARKLAEQFREVPRRFPHIDGVVPVAHTEGSGKSRPNNYEPLMRALAGFSVNPNVGAVLLVDFGDEAANHGELVRFAAERGYPLEDVIHSFLSLRGGYDKALADGARVVNSWLDTVSGFQRTEQPLAHLKIGLQCGGSDAFSGISGNPLAGWLGKETIRHGGAANLAETDELVGAEPYVLDKVRDLATARNFLRKLETFQERASWHGASAAGNPSGGNNFRGLYNIVVKSIGAARKKDPAVRLDYVIDYGEPMRAPGFYFMDSPGNDLESVAGQVAAGCNLILFTTGNGSITNFPYVPTIKIMTNTGRYRMLSRDMDVNAGRYQDGVPMEELGRETFELMLRVASGEYTAGEKAGHSQTQIWREWRQTDRSRLDAILRTAEPSGIPMELAADPEWGKRPLANREWKAPMFPTAAGAAIGRIGLIVPTSLCASQIALMTARELNRRSGAGRRHVALPHTEGCAVAGGSDALHLRTMKGYLGHSSVEKALLLEHGCETTHNDAFRNYLGREGWDSGNLGWASVQLDGGIDAVTKKMVGWFESSSGGGAAVREGLGLEKVAFGLAAEGPLSEEVAGAFLMLSRWALARGGTVIAAENAAFWSAAPFVRALGGRKAEPTLGFAQQFSKPGMHIMETPTEHPVETLTGLGASGAGIIFAAVQGRLWPAHPMVPVMQIGSANFSDDLDVVAGAGESSEELAMRLLELAAGIAAGSYAPKVFAKGLTDFQLTRGLLGISM